jgi:hypothetical protein
MNAEKLNEAKTNTTERKLTPEELRRISIEDARLGAEGRKDYESYMI